MSWCLSDFAGFFSENIQKSYCFQSIIWNSFQTTLASCRNFRDRLHACPGAHIFLNLKLTNAALIRPLFINLAMQQRRIFIFGPVSYFKLEVFMERRGGRSHIFRFRSCYKIFQSWSGSAKVLNMRILLLFRLRLLSMIPKMQQRFYWKCHIWKPHRLLLLLLKMKNDSGFGFSQIFDYGAGRSEKRRILPESTLTLRIRDHFWCRPFWHTNKLDFWFRLFNNSS